MGGGGVVAVWYGGELGLWLQFDCYRDTNHVIYLPNCRPMLLKISMVSIDMLLVFACVGISWRLSSNCSTHLKCLYLYRPQSGCVIGWRLEW